mgnify:CR=1 FL=1
MMAKKQFYKSKTILFGLATIAVAIFNMLAPTDKAVAELTWKELGERQGQQTDKVTDLLVLFGGGGAIYGRYKAKDSIGGKNDEE